jgi:hypothetical protein
MLLEYAEAFLRAHGPRCAPAAGDAVVGGRDSLSVQRTLRPRWRIGAVGNQPQEACAEEPRATGDRGCRRKAGDRAAGLRSGPHCQRAEEARAHGLVRRRALRVAPPRPCAAQGVGSQERPGRPGLTEAQVIALEKAKTEKRHMASSRASIQVNAVAPPNSSCSAASPQ